MACVGCLRLGLLQGPIRLHQAAVQYVPRAHNIHEAHPKGEYRSKIKRSNVKLIRDGLKQLPGEINKFSEEVREKLRADPVLYSGHGDYEVCWKFDKQEAIDEWITTADSDHSEGKSKAEFVIGPRETALFRGYLNTEVPKDGIIKNSGYCNIRSPRKMKSFQRPSAYDWSLFTHLLLRVRGDGRAYQVVISMDRYYDLQWNDVYNYSLFTRGGPYWQTAMIPFSKFYLGAKGRIQDCQEPLQLHQVSFMGISVADGHPGPFQLEIDYIGVIKDQTHTEKFAYELYKTRGSSLY